jgi:hypothetical protein
MSVPNQRDHPVVQPAAPRSWEGLRGLRFSAAILVQGWGAGLEGEGVRAAGCRLPVRVTLRIPWRKMLLLYWECNIDNNSPI